jgi:hypothetical protein
MEEFGDPSVSETGVSETHEKDGPSSTAVADIELEEIPRGRELGSAVEAFSGEVCVELQSGKSSFLFFWWIIPSCGSIKYPL